MPDQEFEYDVFLSHASEDLEWCKMLAERLRNEGVRVWFDKRELQPGDNLLARINDALVQSRKMIAVWSASYFHDGKNSFPAQLLGAIISFSYHFASPLN